jgi:hypothetical protein
VPSEQTGRVGNAITSSYRCWPSDRWSRGRDPGGNSVLLQRAAEYLFGFPVSSNEPTGGSLLALHEDGADLLMGGAFGPESGLAVACVLLASTAALLLVSKREALSARFGRECQAAALLPRPQ